MKRMCSDLRAGKDPDFAILEARCTNSAARSASPVPAGSQA